MTEGLALLREAFPAETVGKLPRVTCKDCSDKRASCGKHKPSKCNECGSYITSAHIHLEYVGHAEVTDRLLSADPSWNWEPVAWTEDGFPRFTKGASGELELWIRLTVCGVTRLGVGSVAGNAFDAEKQLIGDALRNAAMRFGVALDLWAKEELESQRDEQDKPKVTGKATRSQPRDTDHVVDTPPLPADPQTGEVRKSRTRKPPVPVDHVEPRDPGSLPASDELKASIEDLIGGLKSCGDEWAERARAVWREHAPAKGVDRLFAAEAEALEPALGALYREAVASVQPTLDGDAA